MLQSELQSLAANPFLLTIMLIVRAAKSKLPENKGSLFRILQRRLWNRERIRATPGWVPYEQAEPLLAGLAFEMIERGLPIAVTRETARRHLGDDDALLDLAVSASLLSREGEEVRFYHQLIQESFAAVRLLQVGLGQRIAPLRFSPRSFVFPGSDRTVGKWDEVVVAACGLSEDPDGLMRQVAALDPLLACGCVGSGVVASSETAAEIARSLRKSIRSREQAIDSAGRALEEHHSHPMASDRIEESIDRAEWEMNLLESALRELTPDHPG